mmetsp:Transcript_25071/g.58445  ORF Transcript_25071/g.58445 Transcript_25071/m.58445 type:complete len:283 (+) Transcript_25071:231-1079(+)
MRRCPTAPCTVRWWAARRRRGRGTSSRLTWSGSRRACSRPWSSSRRSRASASKRCSMGRPSGCPTRCRGAAARPSAATMISTRSRMVLRSRSRLLSTLGTSCSRASSLLTWSASAIRSDTAHGRTAPSRAQRFARRTHSTTSPPSRTRTGWPAASMSAHPRHSRSCAKCSRRTAHSSTSPTRASRCRSLSCPPPRWQPPSRRRPPTVHRHGRRRRRRRRRMSSPRWASPSPPSQSSTSRAVRRQPHRRSSTPRPPTSSPPSPGNAGSPTPRRARGRCLPSSR